jgi:hypothetical protein
MVTTFWATITTPSPKKRTVMVLMRFIKCVPVKLSTGKMTAREKVTTISAAAMMYHAM